MSASLSLMAAAASATGSPPFIVQILPMVAIFVIFYFLLIRPQQRKMKAHQEKIASVKKGDQVVTGGGIMGKVVRVDDDYADVELAPGLKVKVVKSTISDIVPVGGIQQAND